MEKRRKDRNFAKVQKVNAYESKKEYMERNLETDVTIWIQQLKNYILKKKMRSQLYI